MTVLHAAGLERKFNLKQYSHVLVRDPGIGDCLTHHARGGHDHSHDLGVGGYVCDSEERRKQPARESDLVKPLGPGALALVEQRIVCFLCASGGLVPV